MKRILFLLLLTVSVYGQNPSRFAKIQITGNANSATATKVNVQEANGEVNTQTINTGFNKNIGLGGSDVVGATTLLNQYATTPSDWTAQSYVLNSVVFYGGKQWIAKIATIAGDVPSVSSKWDEITFEALANKTTTVDQTIIDGSTNAVSGNAVFDGLALKNELIAHLKFNNADKTIWNNGYSNVTTATSYGERAGRLASGSYWTANGFQAGYSNTTGSNWTANGSQAGYSNTTGSNWTANGSQAGYSNTTGNYWTANGSQAGFFNTTGSNWTANGYRAGGYLADGTSPLLKLNNGVFIGADTKALEDNSINEIVIGYNATGLGSNSSVIGNSSTLRSRIWGRFLSGTSVDDGVNQLQVAGTISASPATTANQVPTWGQVFDGLALKSNIDHTHVASQITDLSKASVGLGNVDNTSDLSKPLSTATINALATKAPISSVHNPVTIGTANGLSLSTQQLSLGLASSGVTGALSGTDWNTFNNKQPAITGLTANYLPKWNGSGFGNSNIFDNGTNVGIGTTNPTANLTVKGAYSVGSSIPTNWALLSAGRTGVAKNNKGLYFDIFNDYAEISTYDWSLGQAYPMVFQGNGGNSMFGTNVDNGSKVQVNGTISALPATTANQVPTWGQVQAVARPYKVYTALLTQIGNAAPAATVLENTLGGTVVWSRTGTGVYTATLNGAFPLGKTTVMPFFGTLNGGVNLSQTISGVRIDNNSVGIRTSAGSTLTDVLLLDATIEIRIYN